MRTLLIALALIVAAAIAFVLLVPGDGPGSGIRDTAAARSSGAPDRRTVPVRVTAAGTETFRDEIEAVGSARARQSVEVVPLAAGRVEEILFEAGDEVSAGQVLIRLDDRQQRTTLTEARASLAEAESAFERIRSLSENRVSTQSALEQAEATLLRSRAALERAENDLADRVVRATFGGVIGLRQVEVGAWVDTDNVVATLDDLDTIEVEFAVPEAYLARVTPGQTVIARSSAYPDREFEGRITAIDTRVNPASRAFTVRAWIPNEDHALRAGMFVSIRLVLDQRQSLALPEETIVTSGSETFVYVLADNAAARRAVSLGKRRSGVVEVTGGLEPGAVVITSGIQTLDDGTPVRVLDNGAKSARTGEGAAQ